MDEPGKMDEPGPADRPAAEAGLLAAYLSARDAACPGCGYNLRGCAAGACPECGRALRLEIEGRERGVRHRMFLLLALGWVFASGVMNSFRNITALVDEYRWSAQRQPLLIVTQQGGGGGVSIRTTPAMGAGGGPLSIFDLSATSWVRAIWATGLAAAALVGLLILERMLRGPGAAGGTAPAEEARQGRRLVVYAWVLFGLYALWHFATFGREVLGI